MSQEQNHTLGTGLPQIDSVDWSALELAAKAAMRTSYSPYSNYPVGAAAFTDDGRLVSGCNIENASYGVTLCAECSLVSDLFRTGGGRLVAFYCVDGKGEILMPCGRCRQLLFEHSVPGMLLSTVSGIKTIEQVLPDAFGRRDLEAYRGDANAAAAAVIASVTGLDGQPEDSKNVSN